MASSLEVARLTILQILQLVGAGSVQKLSRDIGLAPATIRRHLDIVQQELLVCFQQVRKEEGRPEYVFSPEAGRQTDFRYYPILPSSLMSGIRSLSAKPLLSRSLHGSLPLGAWRRSAMRAN